MFVFVGYSMSDPDFRRVYMEFQDDIHNRQVLERTTYFVSPSSDRHDFRLGSAIWGHRGAVWIPLTACDFFRRLQYVLGSDHSAEARAALVDAYDIKDEAALDDFIASAARTLRMSPEQALAFLEESLSRKKGR